MCPHGEENGNGFTALYQVHPLPLSTAILQVGVLYTTNCCDHRGRRLEYCTDRRYAQLSCRILKESHHLYWYESLEAAGSAVSYWKFQLLHSLLQNTVITGPVFLGTHAVSAEISRRYQTRSRQPCDFLQSRGNLVYKLCWLDKGPSTVRTGSSLVRTLFSTVHCTGL